MWLSLLAVCALAHDPTPDPTTRTLDAAALHWANDRPFEALELLAEEVAAGARRLPTLEGEAASRLADELELLLLYYERLSAPTGARALVRRHAAEIEVAPEHGALFARLARLEEEELTRLHPLLTWQFVGPFDNERGQGMVTPTPPEGDPSSAQYAGKVREVGWRPLPELEPRRGIVRFARLVDPHVQCCVVARTWLESEDERDLLLLLGAAEEVSLWVQGERRFQALGQHGFASDTWCIPLRLEAGWTELALVVGGQDASPAFTARLVEAQTGAPVALPSRASAPEGVLAHALDAGPGGEVAPRPGAWTRWAHGDEARDPESLFRRALLIRDARAAPRHRRPGSEAIEAAVAAAPGVLRYDLLRLATLRERGASLVEEDVNTWLAALDEALVTHGDLPRLLRAKARHASDHQPTHHRALALLDRALAVHPRSVLARVSRADVLNRLGQGALAEAERRALAEDPALEAWPERALEIARSLPTHHPRRAPLIAMARREGVLSAIDLALSAERLATGERGAEGLLAALAEKLAEVPWSLAARQEAAEELLGGGHPAEALALLDEVLALAPERARALRYRSRALLALGERELAAAALEDLLEVSYGAEDERRLLDYLRGLEGAPFHEGYVEPLEAILERRSGDEPIASSVAPLEVLLERRVIEVQPDGTAKRYRRSVQRVLGDAGARALDRRVFRAWAGEEEIRVLRAEVLSPDGVLTPARTGRGGTRGGMVVDLPPLAAGDVVDLEWRRDGLRVGHFGNYFGLDAPLSPDARLPVRESEIVLIAPPSFPLHLNPDLPEGALYEGGERPDGARVHRWRVTGIEPRPIEHLMPPAREGEHTVQASSYGTWEEFGAWWWNLIEDEVVVSPEMAAEVQRLTAGSTTPLDRLRAIYDFVVTEVRYNAWEFGVHGYRPYSAPVIFKRRFGDCKDKAILLKALLSEVGIEAHPVLIRLAPRRFEEDHTLPLVAHFNHCIAWIPEQEGLAERFLDGTARLHPLEVLPDADRGARVLVVREGDVVPTRIPFPDARENLLRDEIRVDLGAESGPRVELLRQARGRFDPRHRQRYTGDPEERDEETQRFMTSLFGALTSEVDFAGPDLEDLGAPIDLRFASGVEEVARPARGGYEIPTTFDRLDLLVEIAVESERGTDLLLDVPWCRELEITYLLGEGERLAEPPAPIEIESEDASYSRRVEQSGPVLRVRECFTLKTHRVPRERYAEFRDLCRRVDSAQAAFLKVEGSQ